MRISQTITEVRGRLIIQGDGKSDAAERSLGLDTRTIETLRRRKVTQTADQFSWPGDWPTHGLRHSYATAALRAGVSPEVVSKRLEHASVVVTLSIYAHVFGQDDQAAAELTTRAIFGP